MKASYLLGLLAPLAVACGSVGDVEKREPIAVVEGQLTVTNLSIPPSNDLRIAVVWTNGQKYLMAEDIPVTPVFPSKFQLQIQSPPPPAAMTSDDEHSGVTFALGALVAYEDKNGNGKLDLVDENASSFVDRVLGANPGVVLAWFEGLPAPASGSGAAAGNGYQFMKIRACEPNEGCMLTTDFLPITTLYEMSLSDEPEFARVMCTNGGGSTNSSGSVDSEPHVGPGPNGVWPATDDPNLTCSPDRKSYTYEVCGKTEYFGLCSGSQRTCSQSTWTYDGAAAPAGWPCP